MYLTNNLHCCIVKKVLYILQENRIHNLLDVFCGSVSINHIMNDKKASFSKTMYYFFAAS